MKLIIQIPCLNEAASLPGTLAALPRQVPGFDQVELLVIDDGSADGTAEIAAAQGADHVLRLKRNRGLARAFSAGLDAALRLGADVIVNTDADNQYDARDIPALVAPVLAGRADLVVGDRRTDTLPWFSASKRRLQALGSAVVRALAGAPVPDATSGFRALSREAALRLVVVSEFSYTLETLIQAGQGRMAVESVPVGSNPPIRPSRLFSSVPSYLRNSGGTLLRVYTLYRPLRVFLGAASLLAAAGLVLLLRFLYYYLLLPQAGHVQSVVVAGTLLSGAFALAVAGVLADLIGANRRMLSEVLYRLRRLELEQARLQAPPPEAPGGAAPRAGEDPS